MNQYDQLSLLYAAVGTFKKAATVASKLIFNDSDYFNANQTGSFAFSFIYNNNTKTLGNLDEQFRMEFTSALSQRS